MVHLQNLRLNHKIKITLQKKIKIKNYKVEIEKNKNKFTKLVYNPQKKLKENYEI